jgi:hypothetical protein
MATGAELTIAEIREIARIHGLTQEQKELLLNWCFKKFRNYNMGELEPLEQKIRENAALSAAAREIDPEFR